MATLSVAARNAALQGIITLLETGTNQNRPSFLSIGQFPGGGGVAFVHNTFFATFPAPSFNAPSGGVAVKNVLPWGMPVTASTEVRELVTWTLRSQAAVNEIAGTFGAIGSGADIELSNENLVITGNQIRLDTFSLAIA